MAELHSNILEQTSFPTDMAEGTNAANTSEYSKDSTWPSHLMGYERSIQEDTLAEKSPYIFPTAEENNITQPVDNAPSNSNKTTSVKTPKMGLTAIYWANIIPVSFFLIILLRWKFGKTNAQKWIEDIPKVSGGNLFKPKSLTKVHRLVCDERVTDNIGSAVSGVAAKGLESDIRINLKGVSAIKGLEGMVSDSNTKNLRATSVVSSKTLRMVLYETEDLQSFLIAEADSESAHEEAFEVDRIVDFSKHAYSFHGPDTLRYKYGLLAPCATFDSVTSNKKGLLYSYIFKENMTCPHTLFLHPLTEQAREHLAIKMVASVMKLHDLGFVHGAIKEDTFLVTEAGLVQLFEFSKSGRIGKDILTNKDSASENYDPEITMQLKYTKMGEKVYADPRIDCFALGKVLYKVLTKKDYHMQYDFENEEEFMASFSKMERPELPELDKIEVRNDLKELVKDLLTPHRKDRPYGSQLLEKYPKLGLLTKS